MLTSLSLSPLSVSGQQSKLLYVMHNTETPLSCFALFEGGPCLKADTNFDILMVKLKSHFQNAKGYKVECRGSRYRYCDFLIKVGTVTMSSSARGISVEVWHQLDGDSCRDAASGISIPFCSISLGGVLSLCGSRRLLEPHEGVHAVLPRLQRPRTSVSIRHQTRRTLCTRRLHRHHDPVPGGV